MGQQVCAGGVCQCTFGVAPSVLVAVIPTTLVPLPAMNIMDNKPFMNIVPFGLCSSIANPTTAARDRGRGPY